MALINITPIMTSNTTPSPYVVSNSSQQPGFEGYKAFNHQNEIHDDAWATYYTGVGWIQLDLSTSTKINAFSVSARNWDVSLSGDATECPKDFILYGSNDGLSYSQIKQISNQIMWSKKETRLFNLDFSVYYRYYKLQIITNNGKSAFTAIGEITFYQDDGVTPVENNKTVSRRYTLPFGSKLRLDNLTSDLTYMLATEDDGENEGTLRIVNHARKFILPKAGQKMDLIFDGNASIVGNYKLSEDITKYSSIRIVADLYGTTENRNSVSQDRTVSEILEKTGTDIIFSSTPNSSSYRYIVINFADKDSFNVVGVGKANGNPCIEKIYGIY